MRPARRRRDVGMMPARGPPAGLLHGASGCAAHAACIPCADERATSAPDAAAGDLCRVQNAASRAATVDHLALGAARLACLKLPLRASLRRLDLGAGFDTVLEIWQLPAAGKLNLASIGTAWVWPPPWRLSLPSQPTARGRHDVIRLVSNALASETRDLVLLHRHASWDNLSSLAVIRGYQTGTTLSKAVRIYSKACPPTMGCCASGAGATQTQSFAGFMSHP